jgi:hypothetical protein
MSTGWWELIFLMFLMKLPLLYLCGVVWWAIKAEPLPPDAAAKLAELPEPEPPPRWRPWRLRRGGRRDGPHGSPGRRVPRAPQTQRAYAKHE